MTDAPRRNLESLKRNLESFRKEAKRWPVAPDDPALRDVQHALAREHGFDGWTALKVAIEQREADGRAAGAQALARYEEKAAALLDAYQSGTPEAMERHYRHTWHRRAWRAMRTYVQLDLGKHPPSPEDDVEITLDDARHLVALEHGFASWRDLEAFTSSLRAGRRVLAKPMRLVVQRPPDEWEPIGGSHEWDEVLELLAGNPSAGLSAEGEMTDDLLAELPRVETLTALGLSNSRGVSDEGIRHLARLPSLQHLHLNGTSVTDAGLQVLRHLPRLKTLVLASSRISDEGLKALVHCHELERLQLWVPQGGDAALRALAGKRKLKHLELAVSDAGLPLIHELPVFKTRQGGKAEFSVFGHRSVPNHLSLRGTFTDRGMFHLRGLEGLFSLDIDDRSLAITSAAIGPLRSLPYLCGLSVDARDDWMPAIAAMLRLQYLGIQDTVAGDDGFAALGASRSIEFIWGRRCHNLGSRGFTALASMPALRGLSVSCLNVGDEALELLPTCPSLRELMPMDIPDAGYRHIGRCAQLEALILMYCRDTTDAATAQITGLSRLTYYFNSYTTITDRTPELLSSMDSLERITFDTCHGLTNTGVGALARLPRLRELCVRQRGHVRGPCSVPARRHRALRRVRGVDNLIGRSGQGWKFTLGWLVVFCAGLLLLVSSAPHDAAHASAAAAAGAMVASIVVGVAVTLSLRCPDCRARWIWMALSRLDHSAWVGWLRTLQACPACGYRGPAEPREESVPTLPKRPLFKDWRNLDRDAILAIIFFFPAIVVVVVLFEGGPWTTSFWVCCAVVVLCLALARRPAVLPAAVAYYCIGGFALYAIFTWRLDALLGTAVCAGIIALAHWWTERPERQAVLTFVADRLCPGCSRPLAARRMSRPVLSDEPSLDLWLHHCECGELTLYKPDGSAERVYDLHRPPEAPA